jgi:hypothetical protein
MFFESLESRRLFSSAIAVPDMAPDIRVEPQTIAASSSGFTLSDFQVGFFASQKLYSLSSLSATINWGDGTTSAGTIQSGAYLENNAQGTLYLQKGYLITGTHTWATSGPFQVSATLTVQTATDHRKILDRFSLGVSRPFIVPTPINFPIDPWQNIWPQTGGVTIQQTVGQTFTEDLGTFDGPSESNPPLVAIIKWGDGESSVGAVNPLGTLNIDGVAAVWGSHKYARTGTYSISITILNASSDQVVATIQSTAIVSANKPTT